MNFENESKAKVFTFILIILVLLTGLVGLDAEVIENPKPTHRVEGIPSTEIIKVAEVTNEDDYDDFILVQPTCLTVDDQGCVYIYDHRQKAVIKLDRDLKFVTRFLNEGMGPFELHPMTGPAYKLYFAPTGHLHVADNIHTKIMVFTREGKPVREIMLDERLRFSPAQPVTDAGGNYYTISTGDHIVDMYNKKNERIHSYLDRNLMQKFLLYRPPKFRPRPGLPARDTFIKPHGRSVNVELLPGNKLIIYLANHGTAYLFENRKLFRTIPLWPDRSLREYKQRLVWTKEFNEKQHADGSVTYLTIIGKITVDKDDGHTFYAGRGMDEEPGGEKLYFTYRFDINGKLLGRLFSREPYRLYHKRHNRFYSIVSGAVKIFEIKKNK